MFDEIQNEQKKKAVKSFALKMITDIQPDVDERLKLYTKRRNMYDGRQQIYSNVVGLQQKDVEGHVMPVFNYVKKMGKKLRQALTNYPFRFNLEGEDESNEIEVQRAEAAEQIIDKVLYDNKFYKVIFKRGSTTVIRDGDTAIKCVVEEDVNKGRDIKMYLAEKMENLYVLWDDVQGTSFSALAYVDEWSNEKIKRAFPGVNPPVVQGPAGSSGGSHDNNQYGMFGSANSGVASGQTKVPKNKIVDFWGWVATEKDAEGNPVYKVVNMIMMGTGENCEIIDYTETDYRRIPWVFVHSEENPGKAWSSAFIDILFDANIELNDRTGEEADVIRIGANRKFVIKNMPDFDDSSLKVGSGQGIYIDGPDADFYPLPDSINIFPSESYKNSIMDHLFNLGLPKIALAAGSSPYTGRIGAIQYQAVTDEVTDMRGGWDVAVQDLFTMIQEYIIDFFPELNQIMTISEETAPGVYEDTVPSIRKVTTDWENPLPLSRSDAVVDASTMYDRRVLPIRMFLEMAGFKDPNRIMKELIKEWKNPDLVPIRSQFQNLADSVLMKQNDANRQNMALQEEMAANTAAMSNPPTATTPPIMKHNFQNGNGNRGVSNAPGVPQTGNGVSPAGAARQVQQNINAGGGQ